MTDSTKGVLGGGGNRRSVRNSGRLAPIFGGGSSRWGLSDDNKQSYASLATSSSFF
jgi:hypothetical protein